MRFSTLILCCFGIERNRPSGLGEMSIQITQLQVFGSGLLVRAFLQKLEAVDESYHVELAAAITIQRFLRGYKCRLYFKRAVEAAVKLQAVGRGYIARKRRRLALAEERKLRNMRVLDRYACTIQKLWRGYHSRKTRFDYYQRQDQLKALELKNKEILQQLESYAETQRLLEAQVKRDQELATLERQAANRHHLLGTKNIQGVFGTVPKFPYHGHKENFDAEKLKRLEQLRQRLGANFHINEANLRNSASLKEWTSNFKKNSMKKVLQLKRAISPPEEKKKKLAMGPFLPIYKLESKKNFAGKPTLRTQVDYEDKDPRRDAKVPSTRPVGEPPHSIKAPKKFKLPELFEQSNLIRGPYGAIAYGTLTFREEDSVKRIHKQDFVTRVKGVDYFD